MASDIFVLLIGCLILTFSLSHLYRVAAIALHVVDRPNQRSAHQIPTPTGAGICFVVVTALGVWLVSTQEPTFGEKQLLPLLPALFIAVLGLADDIYNLSWRIRLVGQSLAALSVMWLISFPELVIGSFVINTGLFGEFLGFFGLVLLLNFYNFMDGIDGLAVSEALFVLSSVLILGEFVGAEASPLLILLVCCLGFLVINWPPAGVFMGDAGSAFLGFLFGILILQETLVPVWTWLILLGYFISDAGLTIVSRLLRGEKIQEAHSQHAYQHMNRYIGTIRTLCVVHAINLFWFFPLAWLSVNYEGFGLLLLILALGPVMYFQYVFGAGQQTGT